MLIEIHMLQNHAPSNLNRDDTGSPKSAIFGGVPRGRISSQALKRAIRRSDTFRTALDGQLAMRTRQLPELVREALLQRGFGAELAELGADKASGFGNKEGKEAKAKANGERETAQTMFITTADIDAIVAVLANAFEGAGRDLKKCKAIKAKDLQKDPALAAYRPLTVDVSLFGRMITSDAFRDADASMQVAHALSTHRIEQEYDYFTAVDDLARPADGDDAGADMIGDVEFNSACYYKYFSLDVDELVGNLTGERPYGKAATDEERKTAREVAALTVEHFLRAAALVSPSGKQNTFAAHQPPSLIVVEVRKQRTPISYANAFVKPVSASREASLVEASIARLSEHADKLRKAFDLEASPRLVLEPESALFTMNGAERVESLSALTARVRESVHG